MFYLQLCASLGQASSRLTNAALDAANKRRDPSPRGDLVDAAARSSKPYAAKKNPAEERIVCFCFEEKKKTPEGLDGAGRVMVMDVGDVLVVPLSCCRARRVASYWCGHV